VDKDNYNSCKRNLKNIKAKPLKLCKRNSTGIKEYRYYIVPLNIYINKHYVEKWGKEYVIEIKKCDREITIRLRPLYLSKQNS
jgi:hypothetical protein